MQPQLVFFAFTLLIIAAIRRFPPTGLVPAAA